MSLFEDMPTAGNPSSVDDGESVWQKCLPDLQFMMEDKDYRQWIAPLKAELSGNELLLLAPNMMWVKHVKERYLAQISELALQHAPDKVQTVRIEMVVSTTPSTPAKKPKAKDKKKMEIYLLFIQHIMYSLSARGKAAIVVPTGFITAQAGIEKKVVYAGFGRYPNGRYKMCATHGANLI